MERDLVTVKLRLFGDLAEVFKAREEALEVERASSLRGLLQLTCHCYERRRKIFDSAGELRSDLNVLRNGRNIRFLNGIDTELDDGDVVSVFPRMFGG
jgi:molybdopterin synthase sulfur carrier subunit